MIREYSHVTQALLGTLFTWGLTALGAAVVVVIQGKQRKLLDASLGFAAGVMVAASYWSLLKPAIEMAEKDSTYGSNGEYAFAPVAMGFLLGALFVYGTDALITSLGIQSPNVLLAMQSVGTNNKQQQQQRLSRRAGKLKSDKEDFDDDSSQFCDSRTYAAGLAKSACSRFESTTIDGFYEQNARRRQQSSVQRTSEVGDPGTIYEDPNIEAKNDQWKRILLLVIAITVHNIPEGLAVGVGFGAIGSPGATFEGARNLALGIGIQNFPEGLAVSLPLQAAGFSTWKSFWYGQLSGMVEPLAGVLGAACVAVASPVLPYALAFAAGAMIYVVVDDIIPEAHQGGNGKLASWGAVVGFLVMMSLDVGLG
ncbi:zinc transporter ZIP11 isoform X1 [Copidosoma floridanum]|uniref:zinc transporter ZIP11 isoform X1 n=1 Tax=Copidosoma floridanum TaxID=29053 RepID=UPI0006C9E44A|nr:zinc transporter ZIP11 isoform X1 [Copidosoma floridanum]XP_014211372.1 zinc transporter ZIP11 isoform X1 [Copidosoma floridanum]XP_014211373.1 zinc transporter ZIP11 isoform X1 [Copidosoma floridanum]